MKNLDITHVRLSNTGLATSPFTSTAEVISHLGAVQAQDFHAAKWALGRRMKHATDTLVEKAFDDGKILRTHVMRPTWHFVLPENIRWMLELTAPRIKTFLAHYDRKLNITPQLISHSQKIFTNALKEGKQLTRTELATHLEKNHIPARGQLLGHIVAHAELDALICSGPRRGKQFTYALLEERVPQVKTIKREEALSKLALTFFTSHGPAQIKDFAWWSGLSMKDAAEGLSLASSKLVKEDRGEKTYWFSSKSHISNQASEAAYLLSIYDEYTIAYKDRSDLNQNHKGDLERLLAMGNSLTSVMILNGKIAGTWKRVLKKSTVEVKLAPFRTLTPSEIDALEAEVKRYGKFLELEAVLV